MGDVGAIAIKMSVSRNLQPVKNVYARAQIQKVPGNYVSNLFEYSDKKNQKKKDFFSRI
jgi:hypothetical protein